MPSFSDSIFLFVLALLLFGPKRLPVLARELGKWVGEFRRASNEFKMQMEEELRVSEQEDRQKKIAAMEAAAPVRPELPADVVDTARADMAAADAATGAVAETTVSETATVEVIGHPDAATVGPVAKQDAEAMTTDAAGKGSKPLPIATSGELKIMPPSTGLPTPQTGPRKSALQELLNAVPKVVPEAAADVNAAEATAHGD